MTTEPKLTGTMVALANYKPKPGREKELFSILEKHFPMLQELELVTDRPNIIAQSADGRIIEIFEWSSPKSISVAHEHPAVTDMWEKMAEVADFLPLNTIPETNAPFTAFELLR